MSSKEAAKLGKKLGESLVKKGFGLNKDGELTIADYDKFRRQFTIQFYEFILRN